MVSLAVLVCSLAISLSAGAIGGLATAREIPRWYSKLAKPAWNPPQWVFGPVWTFLYVLMGIAAWLVWRKVGFQGGWVAVYAVQLVLNTAWSFLFFAKHRPDQAFYEVLVLWVAILVNTILFWQISPIAGALFIPYLAWVSFAAFLNRAVWKLNAPIAHGR